MHKTHIQQAQKQILKIVTDQYPQVYLVGGTAISLLYDHRVSDMELLDLVPGCDTKLVFKHLDGEIIHQLNREYTGI